jgi:hypothetical protein
MSANIRRPEHEEPLLGTHEHDHNVFFSAEEDEFEDSISTLRPAECERIESPSYGPPLRSTMQSREAGM